LNSGAPEDSTGSVRIDSTNACSRREALGRLAALLAAGLWPGALRAAAAGGSAAEFTFVAANDFHHREPACDAWFAALFHQIAAHGQVEFCLGLGDLADKGRPESMTTIARLAGDAGLRFHVTPGNHDNDLEENTAIFDRVLPGQLNYTFAHRGWQFVVIDSTDGKKGSQTHVQPAALAWLDANLPKLDPRAPLVLATHFPLASSTPLCSLNAEEVLARFVNHNLRLVLGGHHHGRTEVARNDYALVTNACCSRVANNHDGTKAKGYWLCRTRADGGVQREFVEFSGPVA
jgi:3',5'-cyclic AMP phosphodiesterase CpdA